MIAGWSSRKRQATVKPGDGRALRPYRWWHVMWRTLFLVDLRLALTNDGEGEGLSDDGAPAQNDGARTQYAVDVDYLAFDDSAALYRDGKQVAKASLPASFPVPGGVIEVATTMYGLRRMHLVREDGSEQQLRPHRGTPEEWRARMGRRFPRTSGIVAGLAIAVLLVSLVLVVPQLLERISEIEWVAERVGTFTSPLSLPSWLNGSLVLAGVLAAFERALTLRSHWLIDADTLLLGD